MDPVTIGLTAGAGALGFLGQHQANATNVRIAREQMKFQERMSGTAMQRHRKDLEAAGYNPMLGVGGPGASTPVGASARVENAPGAGITSGMGARRMVAELELLKEQAQKTRSEEQKVRTESARISQLFPYERAKLEQEGQLTAGHVQQLPYQTTILIREATRLLAVGREAEARTLLVQVEEQLKQLQRPEAEKMAAFWKSRAGTIQPYVSSARDVVGLGSQIATPLIIGRGARAIQQSSRSWLRGVEKSR